MKTTFRDVLASIAAWDLDGIVSAREVKGRTVLSYKGEETTYPHWLAAQKVNQIGADYTAENP